MLVSLIINLDKTCKFYTFGAVQVHSEDWARVYAQHKVSPREWIDCYAQKTLNNRHVKSLKTRKILDHYNSFDNLTSNFT